MSGGPDKLASLGGPAFRAQAADPKALVQAFGKSAAKELSELLRAKNGYFAFESALRVFSDRGSAFEPGLVAWNAADGWRKDYDGMADGLVFFAEDVFGAQFCLRDSEVLLFEPETGELESLDPDVSAWAARVLDHYEELSGYVLSHEWQLEHGPLASEQRLCPKLPFVLGGEYEIANLTAMNALEAMRFRASIAVQIRDLPDGAEITLKVVD